MGGAGARKKSFHSQQCFLSPKLPAAPRNIKSFQLFQLSLSLSLSRRRAPLARRTMRRRKRDNYKQVAPETNKRADYCDILSVPELPPGWPLALPAAEAPPISVDWRVLQSAPQTANCLILITSLSLLVLLKWPGRQSGGGAFQLAPAAGAAPGRARANKQPLMPPLVSAHLKELKAFHSSHLLFLKFSPKTIASCRLRWQVGAR